MCWLCDNPDRPFEDYLQEMVVPVVERDGWALQATPGLAYTIGRTPRGEPELVVTGKLPDDARDLVEGALAGEEEPRAGGRCDLLPGPAVHVVRLSDPRVLTVAWALYGPQVRGLQLVWADSRGDWPWDGSGAVQELLGPA